MVLGSSAEFDIFQMPRRETTSFEAGLTVEGSRCKGEESRDLLGDLRRD
jgi:hypothetical protein